MVTSRDLVMGLDVVSYRLVKVESVERAWSNLSLNIKRYAASPAFELEGLPPEAPEVDGRVSSQSEGKLAVATGEAFPNSGEIQSVLGAALGAADAKQRMMVQVQSRASFNLARLDRRLRSEVLASGSSGVVRMLEVLAKAPLSPAKAALVIAK